MVVGSSVPAVAGDGGTTIAFVENQASTVPFGSSWVLTVEVAAAASEEEHGYGIGGIGPESGTIDVFVEGIAGAYATGIPLQETGIAYVAQPSGQPLLGAGAHTLRAIFNPLAGSRLQTSQTQTPFVLTVAPLTVVAHVDATMDATAGEYPIVTGSLSGSAVDTWGGAPAGIWKFTVQDAEGEAVFEREVAQPGLSSETVAIEVDDRLARNEEHTVVAIFTPDPSLAQGLTVSQAPAAAFTSASASVGEFLVAPVVLDWWIVVVSGILLLLLGGGLAWTLSMRRRNAALRASSEQARTFVDGAASEPEPEPDGSGLGSLVKSAPN
ncbi:hypothetical protein [Agromyces sp. NPDC056965]|uniref:hypothetical protein n=1 Tax=Agromyces sp. NPDC056965 TaxID=3345983 RepID=UPI003625E0AD